MQKVLVVDDDAHIREVVCFALRRAGYQPLQAGDGLAALQIAERELPALIILDILSSTVPPFVAGCGPLPRCR
jgi:two-component system, OmpR family, response regulator